MKQYYCPVCNLPIDSQSKELAKLTENVNSVSDRVGLNYGFKRPMGLRISCKGCGIKLCFDSQKDSFRKYAFVDALFNTQGFERPASLSRRGVMILIAIALIVGWVLVELIYNGILPSH